MTTAYRVMTGLVLLAIAALAFSYARGPKNKKTGAPGEGICVASDCHNDYQLNEGPGRLTLVGIPDEYVPGTQYPITIRLQQKGQSRWGFQVTVITADGQKAGQIVQFDDNMSQLEEDEVNGNTRFYLKHARRGTHNGTTDGPVQWKFTWAAPDSATGEIAFYVAGNAANRDREPTGDYIYQTVQRAAPASN